MPGGQAQAVHRTVPVLPDRQRRLLRGAVPERQCDLLHPLESHLHAQDWSELARGLVDRRLQVLGTMLVAYTPLFDQAVQVNAKSPVILMTLPFAALLALLFRRGGRPLATHLVFSLLFHGFLVVWLCVLLGVLFLLTSLAGLDLCSHAVDWGLFAGLLAATAIYLYLAIGRSYGERALGRR